MTSLPDLLNEAKTGAPPPRYGVEDVVAAGRRRRRRRNSEWAIVAAAVILAVVIGVPQILTRWDGGPPVLPAVPDGPAPSPSVSGLAFSFHGYRSGAYQISDAVWLYPDRTGARVYRAGTEDSVGGLEVYRPGVVPPGGAQTGYRKGTTGEGILTWTYADGAYAVLSESIKGTMTEDDMR
ncbi:MAG TPA: hypothetical protein VN408_10990, partial [Actinoplanes sp.]|nr:hypothetical protein [Actinoplanes sp.]